MSAFNNPVMPQTPKRSGMPKMPETATRVAAHKTDGVKNSLSNHNGSEKPQSMGKLGLQGDGEQK